ncbi:MAG: hypothetical protein WCB67_07360, partial [Solirubrobacteraceae bacterium]
MITNTWVTGGSGVVGVVLGVVGMWTGAGAELPPPPPGAVTVWAATVCVTTVGPELPPPLDAPPDDPE